jgi:hypothetical protein
LARRARLLKATPVAITAGQRQKEVSIAPADAPLVTAETIQDFGPVHFVALSMNPEMNTAGTDWFARIAATGQKRTWLLRCGAVKREKGLTQSRPMKFSSGIILSVKSAGSNVIARMGATLQRMTLRLII